MSAGRTPVDARAWVTVRREQLADCRVFRAIRVERTSGVSGRTHDFFLVDATDWVNVVPITREGELVLVKQQRHGVETFTLELPGGLVDPGETPAEAALRELREETGHRGMQAIPLGFVHPNPAMQTNRCHSFLARDVVFEGAQQLDGREEIDVVLVPVARMRELVREGAVTHALVIAALYLWDLHERP